MNAKRLIFDDVRDVLLTDVAIRIQLSPTLYRLAVRRMDTLAEWLDRVGSPLAERVQLVYAQGSMAVNATIASCRKRDEFDIDLIAQLLLPPGTTPQTALDLLYHAIKGEKGSRYYSMTTRNTRCVTIQYAEMHLDVTPAELLVGLEPRTSFIFHHRPEEPHDAGRCVLANPFGFADWFNTVTPRDIEYMEFFEKRARDTDRLLAKAAETEEVPEQIPAFMKPPAVVALQLIKRNRNIAYERRDGRRPTGLGLDSLRTISAPRARTSPGNGWAPTGSARADRCRPAFLGQDLIVSCNRRTNMSYRLIVSALAALITVPASSAALADDNNSCGATVQVLQVNQDTSTGDWIFVFNVVAATQGGTVSSGSFYYDFVSVDSNNAPHVTNKRQGPSWAAGDGGKFRLKDRVTNLGDTKSIDIKTVTVSDIRSGGCSG